MSIKSMARPFIKWVGGKGQLLEQLDRQLPADIMNWEDVTYIEPFIGGGAMLFYMLQNYPNIKQAVINDINPSLIACYKAIKSYPDELISSLQEITSAYSLQPSEDDRKIFYLSVRERYNKSKYGDVDTATLFIFLNHTCFNGLYRVNKKGKYNVPFGRYVHPKIFDPELIYRDNALLQKVRILNGDYEDTFHYAKGNTLFYFDPPYRPLSSTSSFTDYSKEDFDDDAQIRLKKFCDDVDKAGFKFMLSNSDGKGNNLGDDFFDKLYGNYEIERLLAARSINSNPCKRGKLTEILVHNYAHTKGQNIFPLMGMEQEIQFS